MEGATATQDIKRALDTSTVAEAFRSTVEAHPDDVAIRTKGDETSWTWSELRDRADALAGGLARLGLERGDTVALMIGNRPEFHLADIAAMTVGATPFSIYATSAPDQIQYVVSDAGAKIAIVEHQFLERFLAVRDDLPELEHIVVIDGDGPEGTHRLEDVEGSNPDFDPEASTRAIEPDDLLTLIYTSGTTGPPKGVQLTHRNMLGLARSVEQIIPFPEGARVISWLPSAHIAERGAHHYIPILFAFQVTCCEDPKQVMEYMKDVKPNWFFAVPRIWEKLKSGLETMLASQPEEQRKPVQEALAAARERVRLIQAGEQVPEELEQAVRQADEKMFSGLRAMLGLDEVVTVNVGAAPTPPEVLEFFHAIGIELAELWGLSETTGVATCNPPGKVKIGTVGPAVPGTEIKLADDGEVLVKGPGVMAGYRNLPDKTKETFTDDGWFMTGDIGEIDEDGYLKIVDRKKELIINAAGKNMSPANIESTVKGSSPMIGQCAVIGDRRPYNTALIVLDAEYAPSWAQSQGIEDTSLAALSRNDKVREEVQKGVDAANEQLARVEQVKKFTILPGDWEPGGDELTPTMKLKRKPIAEKYEEEIEALYA